jgi:cholesterol oxidase
MTTTTAPDAPMGVGFRETMTGKLHLGHAPVDDYPGGERDGGAAGFTLDIVLPNLDACLRDPNHPAVAHGTVEVDGLTPDGGAPVTAGVFNFFSPGDNAAERHFLYRLPFSGKDGRPYLLDGHKNITAAAGTSVLDAMTTLYTVVRAGHGLDGAVIATGIIRLHVTGIPGMVRSFTVSGNVGVAEKAAGVERLGSAIFGELWQVYGKPHLPSWL